MDNFRVPGPNDIFSETTGRIVEINNTARFLITMHGDNPNSAIRFNVAPNTIILDRLGRRITISQLRPGFRVRIHHANFMTLSIPPQTTALTIRIV